MSEWGGFFGPVVPLPRGTERSPRNLDKEIPQGDDGKLVEMIPDSEDLETYNGVGTVTDSFVYDGQQFVVVHFDKNAPSDETPYIYLYGDDEELQDYKDQN